MSFLPVTRRTFLQAATTVPLVFSGSAAESAKPLTGVFPIAQTPFTDSDKLDLDALTEQLRFIHRGRVHGFVWPQLASEWSSLSEAERLQGFEALGQTAAKLKPALVLGVQASTAKEAVTFAKYAKKVGANAVIALPPPQERDTRAVFEYYKEVGSATDLPLFVQAVGRMSVPNIIEMYRGIPTLRYVKDEAGNPLFRIAALRQQSLGELQIFTGAHGKTMIDEMQRGFSGTMPAASFADLYAATWDLWQSGRKKEAMEMFGRVSMLINEIGAYGIESLKYILELRGVFRTHRTREKATAQPEDGVGGGNRLDETGKQVLRTMIEHVKPWLIA